MRSVSVILAATVLAASECPPAPTPGTPSRHRLTLPDSSNKASAEGRYKHDDARGPCVYGRWVHQVTVELENGEIRTGTRDSPTGNVTLPGLEVVRSNLLIRVEGEPTGITWSGQISPEGPMRIGVAEPEMPQTTRSPTPGRTT